MSQRLEVVASAARLISAKHGIENTQQLPNTSYQSHLARLAACEQLSRMVSKYPIVLHRTHGCHIQQRAQFKADALNPALSTPLATVSIARKPSGDTTTTSAHRYHD